MNLLITGCCGHIGSYVAENIYKIKKVKEISKRYIFRPYPDINDIPN